MAREGSFFQAGGYNLSELDSFDKEQIMKQHQNARQALISKKHIFRFPLMFLLQANKNKDLLSSPVLHFDAVSVFFTKIFFAACSKQYQARACFYHR